MPIIRITPPFLVSHLWCAIRILQKRSQSQNLQRILQLFPEDLNMDKTALKNCIDQAIKDELIEYTNLTHKKIRIPISTETDNKNEIVDNNLSDYYCYECHCGGDVIKCIKCIRVFHTDCMKKEEVTIPAATIISSTSTTTIIPDKTIYTDITINNNLESICSSDSGEFDDDYQTIDIKNNSSYIDIKPLKTEIDIKDVKPITDDVIFTGDLRPPNKRYLHSQLIKSERSNNNNINNNNDDEFNENDLCSNCLLKAKYKIKNPPFMSIDEINELLNFVYNRIRGWINDDAYSPITSLEYERTWFTKEDLELFKSRCIKIPNTITDIKKKLNTKTYLSLEDFHCDILDVRHCVGIFHGVNSAEYEAVQYLLRDTIFELTEVRQCKDCYRHSNDKKDKLWFSKPCSLRHELVFAKQSGFQYWPAKVIKVINNEYDVRFFGPKHSRALVNANFVKSIDSLLNSMEIKKTAGFLTAMRELGKHQELLALPHGTFSYESEKYPQDISLNNNNYTYYDNLLTPIKQNKTKMNLRENKTSPIYQHKKIKMKSFPIGNNKRNTPTKTKGTRKRQYTEEIIDSEDENPYSEISETCQPQFNINISKNLLNSDALNTQIINKEQIEPRKLKIEEPIPSVSSSCVYPRKINKFELNSNKSVETLKRKFACLDNIEDVKKIAIRALQNEIDFNKSKMEQIIDEHKILLKDVKKKRWCSYCERESMYNCCWNASYCSVNCQELHWKVEHQKVCKSIEKY